VHLLFAFLLRLVLLAAGLLAAAAIALLVTLLLGAWLLRAGWARLTGRPVSPFATRFGPRQAFEEMMRRAPAAPGGSRTPRADAVAGRRGGLAEVSDVEPK
jgi:branched-subunit amino acid ABC-type transport system permease component